MQFTYESYRKLITTIRDNDYIITSYHEWGEYRRSAILRHDIDNSIDKAVKLAWVEKESGVSSTYFVLLTSDFYNVFSAKSSRLLREIISLGHEIGLHFDEVRYPDCTLDQLQEQIKKEAALLSSVIEQDIRTVSMHRPSKMMLDADLTLPGMINSYGQTYFRKFKYLSDSRRRWREPVESIISSGQYDRLHILTHAFWYHDYELDIHDSVKNYVNCANIERYASMSENITDIASIMSEEEIVHE